MLISDEVKGVSFYIRPHKAKYRERNMDGKANGDTTMAMVKGVGIGVAATVVVAILLGVTTRGYVHARTQNSASMAIAGACKQQGAFTAHGMALCKKYAKT